jgi:hypothetical protein
MIEEITITLPDAAVKPFQDAGWHLFHLIRTGWADDTRYPAYISNYLRKRYGTPLEYEWSERMEPFYNRFVYMHYTPNMRIIRTKR